MLNESELIQNQLTLMNDCFHCQQLNELCSDCLDAKEARDAVIANQLVDDEIYNHAMAKIQDEPSAHDWISNEVITRINPKTGDKTIRTEFFEQSSWLIDRIFNLDESMTLDKSEVICDSCHYVTNKHAVCPNCN